MVGLAFQHGISTCHKLLFNDTVPMINVQDIGKTIKVFKEGLGESSNFAKNICKKLVVGVVFAFHGRKLFPSKLWIYQEEHADISRNNFFLVTVIVILQKIGKSKQICLISQQKSFL